jgi:hypothetical protein
MGYFFKEKVLGIHFSASINFKILLDENFKRADRLILLIGTEVRYGCFGDEYRSDWLC